MKTSDIIKACVPEFFQTTPGSEAVHSLTNRDVLCYFEHLMTSGRKVSRNDVAVTVANCIVDKGLPNTRTVANLSR